MRMPAWFSGDVCQQSLHSLISKISQKKRRQTQAPQSPVDSRLEVFFFVENVYEDRRAVWMRTMFGAGEDDGYKCAWCCWGNTDQDSVWLH